MAVDNAELQMSDNREKIAFISTLFNTLTDIKNSLTITDIYINFSEKIEIYVFVPKENIDEERKIYEKLTEWESKKLYFPELFIYQEDEIDGKMNILPRGVMKIC